MTSSDLTRDNLRGGLLMVAAMAAFAIEDMMTKAVSGRVPAGEIILAIGIGSTRLESPSGPVAVELLADGDVRADMGQPRFAPADIPLLSYAAAAQDEYTIDVAGMPLRIGAVSMGNPHAVLEVGDIGPAPVGELGPRIEAAAAFPRGCNVGFAEVLARDAIRLRVWERGVGETLACGSGACAAVAVLRGRGRLDAVVRVELPGGVLVIEWQGPGHPVWMSGPASFVFEGEFGNNVGQR